MSPQSRLVAGIVLIVVPTVEIGGASILSLLIADPAYAQNDLRQDLWRAGHAHGGVWLVLSLVALRYVDEATLSEGMRWVVRVAFPVAAVLMALGFFLSVLSPETLSRGMAHIVYLSEQERQELQAEIMEHHVTAWGIGTHRSRAHGRRDTIR